MSLRSDPRRFQPAESNVSILSFCEPQIHQRLTFIPNVTHHVHITCLLADFDIRRRRPLLQANNAAKQPASEVLSQDESCNSLTSPPGSVSILDTNTAFLKQPVKSSSSFEFNDRKVELVSSQVTLLLSPAAPGHHRTSNDESRSHDTANHPDRCRSQIHWSPPWAPSSLYPSLHLYIPLHPQPTLFFFFFFFSPQLLGLTSSPPF